MDSGFFCVGWIRALARGYSAFVRAQGGLIDDLTENISIQRYAMTLGEGDHEDRWIAQGVETVDAENVAA